MNKDVLNVTDEQVATAINLEVLGLGRTLDQYGEVGKTRDYLRANLCRVGNITVEQALKMAKEGHFGPFRHKENDIIGYVMELLRESVSAEDSGLQGEDLRDVQQIVSRTVGSNEGTSIAA